MIELDDLFTPCLVLDRGRMSANIARMAERCRQLGVALRPHVKTPKSAAVAEKLRRAGARGLTVSTLQEAEYFLEAGFEDIFYAVPLDARKVARAAQCLREGHRLTLLTDTLAAAQACARAAELEDVILPFWVEIDVDHYRTGVALDSPEFLRLVGLLVRHPNLDFVGLMSYGGASYNMTPAGASELAETHRDALVRGKIMLEKAGFACPATSFGSSPAVLHARSLEGVSEARCGIYVFQDLFQAGIEACRTSDIALSVLATVISSHPDHNRIVVDAGGLALSKDRSTQGRSFDAGFGLICTAETGEIVPDIFVSTVSQELGLVTTRSGGPFPFERFPVGSRLRILPNHADMTAAAYESYHVVDGQGGVVANWDRVNRW